MVSQKTPLVVRIPLVSADEGEEVSDRLQSITSAWEDLMQGNISSLKGDAVAKGKKKHSAAQKAAWWDKRTALDADMGKLLNRAEHLWFGGLKGMLAGEIRCPANVSATVAERAAKLVGTVFTCTEDHASVDAALVEVVLASSR